MKILKVKYIDLYREKLKSVNEDLIDFKRLSEKLDFEYLTESSSVFSSNIEWNTLDLNSFKNLQINKSITKNVKEIECLINAYKYAKRNTLNEKNLLKIHYFLSETLLIKSKRWVYRDEKVWVFWKQGLVYMALEAEKVRDEMWKLFDDIKELLNKQLTQEEVFYYASMIHLVFAHIHPFPDWNGRCARLLEKWFLVEKLWVDLWKLRSEEFYWNNRQNYYDNISLWVNYYELNYDNSLGFLFMLPSSLKNNLSWNNSINY